MRMAALRGLVLVLAAAVYDTAPLPVPVAPELMVIQEAAVETVQAQPCAVMSWINPLDVPPAGAVWVVADWMR